jgi:hypothetical protein
LVSGVARVVVHLVVADPMLSLELLYGAQGRELLADKPLFGVALRDGDVISAWVADLAGGGILEHHNSLVGVDCVVSLTGRLMRTEGPVTDLQVETTVGAGGVSLIGGLGAAHLGFCTFTRR